LVSPWSKVQILSIFFLASLKGFGNGCNETTQILKGLLTDLLTKSWNARRFMEEDRKLKKQKKLRKLWAEIKLTKFDPLAGPQINFT